MAKTILVVDYDQASLAEIQSFLADGDFELLTARDGIQAQQLFEKKSPHLVLTDALLPKLNGFELCKRISTGQLGEIRPVIMFSGIYKAEKYRKEAIIGCGAVDFLERPLVKWQLLKVIKKAFSEIPSGKAAPQTQSAVTTGGLIPLPGNMIKPEPVPLSKDDLLEIDLNFERIMSGNAQSSPTALQDQAVLDGIMPEPDPSSTLLTASPIEQQGDEVKAAADAYRADLGPGMRIRGRKIVEDIGEEIAKDEKNILEFEAAVEKEKGNLSLDPESDVIELDNDIPRLAEEAAPTQTLAWRPNIPQSQAKSETREVPVPDFTIASKETGNRLPQIAVVLLLLLLVLLLFLKAL